MHFQPKENPFPHHAAVRDAAVHLPLPLVREVDGKTRCKTSAEISPEEKNRISHRAKALKALVEKIDRGEKDN